MNPRSQVQVEVGVPRSLENVFISKCWSKNHISQETAVSFSRSRENCYSLYIPALGRRGCLTSHAQSPTQSSALFPGPQHCSQSFLRFSRFWWEPWRSQDILYYYISKEMKTDWVKVKPNTATTSPSQHFGHFHASLTALFMLVLLCLCGCSMDSVNEASLIQASSEHMPGWLEML